MSVELSAHQQKVQSQILDWFSKPGDKSYLTLGGYAGTGKTTLIGYLRGRLKRDNPNLRVAFASFTGKASRVLKEKLKDAGALFPGDSVSTLHRLLYVPVTNSANEVIGWEQRPKDKFPYGLVVVDEASMVSGKLWQDLVDLGVLILAVGDHGQLPPIEGEFNLMANPDLRLEEIHRQVAGHPIIQLATLARRGEEIAFGRYAKGVYKLSRQDSDTQELLGDIFTKFDDDMLVLTGYNFTRQKINKAIRQMLEFESEQPRVGDRVICLKNNYQQQIYNGMLGTLHAIERVKQNEQEFYTVDIYFDGEDNLYKGNIAIEQFGAEKTMMKPAKDIDLFDFGYSVTVHKAQGSQADTVVVFTERFSKMDDDTWNRWLYTAITRAVSRLYLVS